MCLPPVNRAGFKEKLDLADAKNENPIVNVVFGRYHDSRDCGDSDRFVTSAMPYKSAEQQAREKARDLGWDELYVLDIRSA